ncbi:alpha/beta fold hydrolase [Singulisphaera sp. PoT]|uniref:alpha/beta fold hydrolase n=1 Tax=Singulisphaera sp. PoT TaxID=3411797 RepID=UPI003BF4B57F
MREHEFLTNAGIKLNFGACPEGLPPVVMLHGVTRRWQDWLTLIPSLAPRWRSVSLDLRGHGRSARVPGGYRVADYVPDVVDFLRRGIGEPAILIGHSLGGNVAAAVAAEAPERVKALVLEDPPLEVAGPMLAETPFPAMFRVYLRHAGSTRPIPEIVAELSESLVPAPGHENLVRLGEIRDAVALRVIAAGLKQLAPEVLAPPLAGRWLDGFDVSAILHKIKCPTLLIQADEAVGGLLPDALASRAKGLIRECLAIKLRGIGHNIHGNASEAMARLVVPFLASLD